MTTHNAYKYFDSHFLFYTVTCPPLRVGEDDDVSNVTYNTPLLTDELHSRKGYPVNTIASYQCVVAIFTILFDIPKDYENPVGWNSVTCKSSGKWSEPTAKTCNAGNENKNLCSADVFYFDKLFFKFLHSL